MLFAFFLLPTKAAIQCAASINTPPKVPEGYTAVFTEVLVRHGARAPQTPYMPAMNRGYWLCDADDAVAPHMFGTRVENNAYRRVKHVRDPRLLDFLPNCVSGDLVLEGMRQHERLGKFYGDYVKNTLHLFDRAPTPDQVFVRCTDFDRTLRSAQSFLHGAFPPQQPNEVWNITHGYAEDELLRPNGNFCADLKKLTTDYYASEDYTKWLDTNWDKLADLATSLNVTVKSADNLNLVADWVLTYVCNNQKLPVMVTDELIETCHHIVAAQQFGVFNQNPPMAASYMMREFMKVANEAVQDRKVKFSLMSAHDSTMMAILSLLKAPLSKDTYNTSIPPYASALSMEIYENQDKEIYVRWLFNEEEIPLPDLDNKVLVKWDDFKKAIDGIYHFCAEQP